MDGAGIGSWDSHVHLATRMQTPSAAAGAREEWEPGNLWTTGKGVSLAPKQKRKEGGRGKKRAEHVVGR